ncbi:hypothetical protein TIFTF001_032897 [Ficus carica]|uniref:Uncharacterized protein n=1 Tax=Ficus carica TaxID=3494 RepID=A0AA88DXG8_FICCA|nr:hypothetical protein TIFTF001_032897 [Ficus carica]
MTLSKESVGEGEDETGGADAKFIGFDYLEENSASKLKVKEVEASAEQALKVDSTGLQLTYQALVCYCYSSSCCEDSFRFCGCCHVCYVFLSFFVEFASKVKKEYMSHATMMEKMGSAKSLVFSGKDKAGDSGS